MKRSASSTQQNPAASAGKVSAGRAQQGKPSAGQPAVITATAPCRVDLAGGTVDIWPLYLFHPGAVTVNVAVDIQTRCRIAPSGSPEIHLSSIDTGLEDRFPGIEALQDAAHRPPRHALAAHLLRFFYPQGVHTRGGLWLETKSDGPAGAGISGSSALMIATTAALARHTGRALTLEQIREIAQNVEAQLIKVPTGCQDYFPALYGGVSAIHLDPDGLHRETIAVSSAELEARAVLVYTGVPRQSGINNWEVFKAHIDGSRRVRRNFQKIVEIAQGMATALRAEDWEDVERLLREEWKLRKTNAPGISTPFIDRLIRIARRNGGRAAKVCGAGGGGCVFFLVEAGARERVSRALTEAGGQILPFRVAAKGLEVCAETTLSDR
jgi:D-glycero-alpha-D-manno-heptose-7-phosphate kinase